MDSVEPKIVLITGGGIKLYWCHLKEQQMIEQVCKGIYFRRSSRVCRFCLGIKGDAWPEPWASMTTKKGGNGDENDRKGL